jgi:hypothetical protein
MKYITLLSIIGTFIFSACQPEPLEIEIPELEPQVVVFSQIIPDQIMTVALTKTISALNFSEEEGDTLDQDILNTLLETDATVIVSYRDVTDTLFEIATGVYASISTPQYVNETYTLEIETQDGKTLRGINKMLPLITFDQVIPVIEVNGEDTLVTVDFRIVDLPEDNWYMLNIYSNGEREEDGIDLNSFFQSGSNLLKKTELLSDDAFENDIFEGTIELPNVNSSDSIVVTLSNINEEYYRFLEIRQSADNFFTQLTKEPITLPTNIEGGLGFFNTHFPNLRYFDLNEF